MEDILGLLQGLEIPSDSIVAVGHSMGGIVVPMLASKCSLHGAVLLGPVLPRAALADIFNARIETVKKGQCLLAIRSRFFANMTR